MILNSTKEIIKPVANAVLDTIFPPRCISCNKFVGTQGSLCTDCWEDINYLSDPCCDICGIPFEFNIEQGALCGACIAHKPSYDKARSVFLYDDNSRSLITSFKYGDKTQNAVSFAKWLERVGKEFFEEADIVAPVPLHRFKLFLRRYNQSVLITNALKLPKNANLINKLLVRNKYTSPQAGLTTKQRILNVKGAFKVNLRYNEEVKGKVIVLVDDVMTTGSTVEICSRVLKKQGAKKVYILTVARTVID